MNVKISKEANKVIGKQPKHIKNKILQTISSPPPSSIHHYVGNFENMFVIRVKEYRIICRKDGNDIVVESCGVRGDVYKRTRKRLGNHISA